MAAPISVRTVVVIEGLHQAIQGVVAQLPPETQAVSALHEIAVSVIAAAHTGIEDDVVETIHHLSELPQRVESTSQALVQRAAGVVDLLSGFVTGRIQGVLDVVASGIGDLH